MKQYFDNDVKLVNNEKEIVYEYSGEKLRFKTNSGLFAKDGIDEYSIALVDNILKTNYSNILDLGCGYGFIGIALSKVCEYNHITFIDVTKRACDYTKINCDLNKVNNAKVINSNGIQIDEKYDLITLNPPIHAGKEIVYTLYQNAKDHLASDGKLYIVIHKKHGAKSTIDFLKTTFKEVTIVSKRKSLYVICLTN